MRQIIFLMLLLFLPTVCLQVEAQEAYGWNRHNSQQPEQIGPCKFNATNPSELQVLRTHDYSIRAGAFAGKKYYVQTCVKTGDDPAPLAFGLYDFATGTFTKVADATGEKPFYDMAYDYKNGIMYALGKAGRVSTLLKVDLGSGTVMEVTELAQEFVALAVDLQGQIYAENPYSELVKLALDGNEETLNSCDYSAKSDLQSMGIDHKSGKLWWAIPTTREGTQLLDIDVNNGYNDSNVELVGEKQIVGLDFPYSTLKDGAPSMVENFSVEPTSAGAMTVSIRLNAPRQTVAGGVLGACSIHLLRGGQEVFSKDNVAAGELITFSETLTADDLYAYKVYASNSEGNGEETVKMLYVGEDIPDAVSDIQLEKQLDGKSCKISWTAPTKGINGGCVPARLRYKVVRLPDNVVVGEDVEATTIMDNTIPRLANYQYRITSIGRQEGKSALSSTIVLGTAHTTPYSCRFTTDDLPLWTFIDRNHDGITWKQRMAKEGIYCSYSEKQAGDDWAVSRPIALKAGTKYKIVVTAAAANLELVEKMSLLFGQGDREEDLAQYREVAAFEVSNEEGARADYVAYYTPTTDGNENFAIRMNSDANKFQLEVFSILIKEASEGSLHGVVKHEGAPLADVKLSLKGTDFTATTNMLGEWNISHVPEADYTLEARKEGYALHRQTVRVSADETVAIEIALEKLEKLTVGGQVTYAGGTALSDARIVMTAENSDAHYVAYTNGEGKYAIEGVYEGDYRFETSHLGLLPDRQRVKIETGATTLPTITLKDKVVAPRLVSASEQSNAVVVAWEAPIDTDSISYYKGKGVAHIGVFAYTPYSIVGTVFRKDMAITAVKWQTDEFRGPHKKVDLVIFALDSEGKPTNNILYEQANLLNTDNQWCRYELPKPLVVKGGALVAFRYDGYLSMLADAGESEGIDFEPNVHVINTDYRTAAFEYLDQHDMKKNLLIGIDYAMLAPDGSKIATTVQRQTKYNVYRKLEQGGEDWKFLASTTTDVRTYRDSEFATLPMGYYRYAVASVLPTDSESAKAASACVGRNLIANLTFKVKANASLPATVPTIRLQADDDKTEVYTATQIDETTWNIPHLTKKKYYLYAELDGFDDLSAALTIDGEETEFRHELDFKERLLAPYNLKVAQQGADVALSWNEDNFIFDDFDSYEPFTLEPATSDKNWIYWDMDKAPTVEFDNISFKYMGSPMSYMVFNPYATTPALVYFDAGSLPYSGRQCLASFGNRDARNNDFVFSPILNFTGKATFRCVVKSFTNVLGAASIRIGYTKTDYPKTTTDIVWLSEPLTVSDKNWQELSVEVPVDARRMVLVNETPRGFFLMVDNLFVGEECPYADGKIKKPLVDRAAYEVMIDGRSATNIDSSTKRVLLTGLSAGEHTAEIAAVYQSGRSEVKRITFDVQGGTDIDNVTTASNLSAHFSADGRLLTGSAVDRWEIYDAGGRFVLKGTTHNADVSKLSAAYYVVRLHKLTHTKSLKLMKR